MAALQFEHVSKHYAREEVLKSIELTVNANEFIGLVGVNGAGKTTLIKGLLDFCDMDGGTMEIFGVDHKLAEARARLAFLPERFAPPSFVTGKEFLRHMARLYGLPFDRDRIAEVLDKLDLDPGALDKPVKALSKGMAQKLGLAACLSSGRDLFVLDEPMSGLDPKARAMFKRYLLELKDKGHTLFFSTHLLADVEQICDRMAVLHGGVLRYVGSPHAFMSEYDARTLEDAYLQCVGGNSEFRAGAAN